MTRHKFIGFSSSDPLLDKLYCHNCLDFTKELLVARAGRWGGLLAAPSRHAALPVQQFTLFCFLNHHVFKVDSFAL